MKISSLTAYFSYCIKDKVNHEKSFTLHITTNAGTKISRNKKHLKEGVLKRNTKVTVNKVIDESKTSKILYVTVIPEKPQKLLFKATEKLYKYCRRFF